ncbi:MAG: ABC transporter ATP-binding protein, partial [Thermoplasmata archaeon]|nr:ABC transporter ATP-binding protein [Thermoplasmata archaeon]
MSSSELLRVDRLSAAWDGAPILREVSFSVDPGEFVVLMGPNGSGKTTLLRAIAGLEQPTGGSVVLNGRAIDSLPTHRRGIGFLFQEPALFPTLDVWENVAFGLRVAKRPPTEVDRRVGELLTLLRLTALSDRRAHELSGGERQRAALARTLATAPSLVLLDEPFASVDAQFRAELRAEFRRVLRSVGTAAIHVTHDREEGLFLGERVLVLLDGALRQEGRPEELFDRPVDADVARFLGYNVLTSGDGEVAVRPEELEPTESAPDRPTARVLDSGFGASGRVVYLEGPSGV